MSIYTHTHTHTHTYIYIYIYVPVDSLVRGPKLLSIKNYVMFVNHLTDDELTTGYYQQVTLQMPACEKLKVF